MQLTCERGGFVADLICRARVPSTRARSYLVIYLVVILGRSDNCACPSLTSTLDPSSTASGISSSPSPSKPCSKRPVSGLQDAWGYCTFIRVCWECNTSSGSLSKSSRALSSSLSYQQSVLAFSGCKRSPQAFAGRARAYPPKSAGSASSAIVLLWISLSGVVACAPSRHQENFDGRPA